MKLRSLQANARLHSLLTDISEQLEWAGQKRDVLTWKRLATAAWLRAIGEHIEILPALDGKGFDVIYERTSKMTVAQVNDLMQWLEAYGAEVGVRFRAPEYMEQS